MLCGHVWGLAGNLSGLTLASYQYDILFSFETLVSDMLHVSELLVPGFGRPVMVCRGKMPWARGMAAYGYGAFRQPKFDGGCCEMLVFRVCGVHHHKWCVAIKTVQNLYVYSLYRNPDLDDRIFDCILASMAAVQTEDVRASFLFVGDLNGHNQEWLGSTTTNRPPLMRGLDIHKNIPVSVTKLTLGLGVSFSSFHLTADKLIPSQVWD